MECALGGDGGTRSAEGLAVLHNALHLSFECLDVRKPIDDATAQLQISWPLLRPTPSFEGPVADLPTCSQFNLVQANSAHFRLLSRNSLWSQRNEGVRKFLIQVSYLPVRSIPSPMVVTSRILRSCPYRRFSRIIRTLFSQIHGPMCIHA